MKQKIKEALRQEYKSRLELNDEQLEGMAAFAVTFAGITDESKIEEFVKNDATFTMLKSYQSVLDKDRAKRKANPEAKEQPSDNGNQPNPEPKPQPEQPDIAAIVAQAVTAAVAPLQEKLNAFETTRAKETAVAALDKLCAEWDYAQGFPKERDEAKRIALKVYKAGGEQMTGEQLIAAFREEFDPAVKDKGVTDFSKPFQSDGAGGGNGDTDFGAMAQRLRDRGKLPSENKE